MSNSVSRNGGEGRSEFHAQLRRGETRLAARERRRRHAETRKGRRRPAMKIRVGWSAVLLLAAARGQAPCPIRFEETAAKAGVNFTHSFGAEKLGSLLESAGAG